MNPPAHEIERRRPVWEALSAVFLDTEIDDAWRAEIVATARASGYSVDELDAILWRELCPVLYVNLLPVAGEWSGFDMAYVEQQILAHPAGRLRQWWSYAVSGHTARDEWQRVRDALTAARTA